MQIAVKAVLLRFIQVSVGIDLEYCSKKGSRCPFRVAEGMSDSTSQFTDFRSTSSCAWRISEIFAEIESVVNNHEAGTEFKPSFPYFFKKVNGFKIGIF
jgi:hypothetical protein